MGFFLARSALTQQPTVAWCVIAWRGWRGHPAAAAFPVLLTPDAGPPPCFLAGRGHTLPVATGPHCRDYDTVRPFRKRADLSNSPSFRPRKLVFQKSNAEHPASNGRSASGMEARRVETLAARCEARQPGPAKPGDAQSWFPRMCNKQPTNSQHTANEQPTMANRRTTKPERSGRSRRNDAEVERFVERQRPKRAKLDIWQEHLLLLAARGASYREMAAFVSERGTPCSGDEAYRFLNRKKRAAMLASALEQRTDVDSQVSGASDAVPTRLPPAPVMPPSRTPAVTRPIAPTPTPTPTPTPKPTSAPAPTTAAKSEPLRHIASAPTTPASQPREPGRLPKFVWPQPTSNDNQEW
jgi:hypothetical protein